MTREEQMAIGANARSVWTIATQPYPEAHFATFPEELARRCIVAGTSQRGGCPTCGAAWVRVEQVDGRRGYDWNANNRAGGDRLAVGQSASDSAPRITRQTIGWQATCACGADPIPDTVLDPFGGSGTVAQVATGNGRSAIHIDLNPAYIELARQRIGPMLCEVI
jgi:hypothetical protein